MKLICLIILSLQLSANEAHAYVDPNTGGYVFQLLYPIFVAIGIGYFFLKRQIKQLFLSLLETTEDQSLAFLVKAMRALNFARFD